METAGGTAVMYVLDDGELVLSPSDLGFAACAHLTQLELRATLGEIERLKRDDPLLDVLSRHGGEHEAKQLEELGADEIAVGSAFRTEHE
jgi:hypothetical protein